MLRCLKGKNIKFVNIMRKINKIIMLLVLMMSALVANAAENATKILDKTAETFKKSGDVKIGFTINVGGQSSKGIIKISGQKFCCSTSGSVVWFDGKTMWHYVQENEEVNVTNPSEKEITRINPYAFLSIYKKGYNCKVTKTTDTEYYITLSGKKNSPYKSISLRLNKSNYQLTYVKTVTAKRTTEITVNSYIKNQKFPAYEFSFNKKEFPAAEIVDLR